MNETLKELKGVPVVLRVPMQRRAYANHSQKWAYIQFIKEDSVVSLTSKAPARGSGF